MEEELGKDFYDFHKMKKPQRDLEKGDWESLMKFFKEHNEALLESFDFSRNTVIHRVAALNKPQILRDLLGMLSPRDRWHALRRKNVHGNTVLHNGMLSVEIAQIVLEYEKELPRPTENILIDQQQQEEKDLPLLEITNAKGATPIYRAAFNGKLKLLKYFANQVADLRMHYHRKQDRFSILHASVSSGYFDVALWLLNMDSTLAKEKDDNERTSLQLLSTIPFVFRSGLPFGTIEELIYYFLPEFPYNPAFDVTNDDISVMVRDIESGEKIRKHDISVLSRINSAIWKWLAEEWVAIERISVLKMMNKLAEKLADVLVQEDYSWMKSWDDKQRPIIMSTAIFYPSNISSEPKRDEQYTSDSDYTPLLLAAAKGIVEIVERILKQYPEAINHVSKDELNILHVAVIYRQKKIYRIIKKNAAYKSLSNRLASNGNSVLHQVGSMKFYKGRHEAGIAYQLQEELRWLYRVGNRLPNHLVLHCNDDKLTALELFQKEHEKMLIDAQDWIKGTAQSCSTVAILVASVVYAAAYSSPGGTDDRGFPNFLGTSNFLFFTIMDVVALVSSLASVVMFLSILTSSFQIKDFYKSVFRRLSLGFAFLFLSLISTMLAFSATVVLTMKLEKSNKTLTLIYSAAALFPIGVFMSFRKLFYEIMKDLRRQILRKILNMIPNSFKRLPQLLGRRCLGMGRNHD